MAVMVSSLLVQVLSIFCLFVVPSIWAEDCTSYIDSNNIFHPSVECDKYCCGDCGNKYCCSSKNIHFTLEKQNKCPQRPAFFKGSPVGLIAGIAGAVVFIVICVCLIVCCVVPCCLCYKICRKQHNQRQIVVTNSAGAVPSPPYSPSGYQAPPSGYQPVSGHDGLSMPTAPPPSYMECIAPSYPPAPFTQEQPMYPLTPPNQPYAAHLPEEVLQPPYNPSYGPQP